MDVSKCRIFFLQLKTIVIAVKQKKLVIKITNILQKNDLFLNLLNLILNYDLFYL